MKPWKIIGRGFNGWHAANEECHSSGGYLFPYEFYGKPCKGYLAEAAEGCFVYDADPLRKTRAGDEFERWILSGPMAEPKLTPGTISKAYDNGQEFGPFDYVAVDVWAAELIKRIPEIKHGIVKNGAIVWSC